MVLEWIRATLSQGSIDRACLGGASRRDTISESIMVCAACYKFLIFPNMDEARISPMAQHVGKSGDRDYLGLETCLTNVYSDAGEVPLMPKVKTCLSGYHHYQRSGKTKGDKNIHPLSTPCTVDRKKASMGPTH